MFGQSWYPNSNVPPAKTSAFFPLRQVLQLYCLCTSRGSIFSSSSIQDKKKNVFLRNPMPVKKFAAGSCDEELKHEEE